MFFRPFKFLELWWREGSWWRPKEWVFEVRHDCHNGCVIVEVGFWGFTLLKGDCIW